MIVGKNNVGKTTIISALSNLIKKDGSFSYSDINFSYLKSLYKSYEKSFGTEDVVSVIPHFEFDICVGVEPDSKDIISNLAPFMTIGDVSDSEILIKAKCEIEDEVLKDKLNKVGVDQYDEYIKLLRGARFRTRYFDTNGELVKGFSLNQLIALKTINANIVKDENCLSKAFNKIVKYRVNKLQHGTNIDKILDNFNKVVTNNLRDEHTDRINTSIAVIESADHIKVHLRSDASFEQLLTDIVKYEYIEDGQYIPENQFGLGYTNLMMIIAELIDYMEQYPDDSFNSRINLISIEEPENHMHPQMQENFIKSINEAIISLLEGRNKKVNSQLIITTHSSHILNSKIHSGSSFDFINYITSIANTSKAVCLTDELIAPSSSTDKDAQKRDFAFLKKHIKYKVSELFFSDAVIFVEGITEETLLNYYIDVHPELNKRYISIFNINGAHGLVYHNLIKALSMPALIVTDLDIERNDTEKEVYTNITTLKDRTTTNATLTHYNKNKEKIETIELDGLDDNMMIVYQKAYQNQYPTSFEEAFILKNNNNDILDTVLKEVKRNTYKQVKESDGGVIKNSYRLQRMLASSKSEFANTLLYHFLNDENTQSIPEMPDYILDGIEWLINKLKGGE